MDWELIAHGAVRYSLLYAGTIVALVAFVTESETLLFGLFLVGLLLLFFVAGGAGSVRSETLPSTGDTGGLITRAPGPVGDRFEPLDTDLRLLFFGLGVLVWAATALTLT